MTKSSNFIDILGVDAGTNPCLANMTGILSVTFKYNK